MTEQKLRVTEVRPADPNYVHDGVDADIPAVTEGRFKGHHQAQTNPYRPLHQYG
jgi:hypothetical protein